MEKLFTLLALQRQALEAKTQQALSHVMVNETLRLISYKQAIFWRKNEDSVSLEKISGNAVLDEKSLFAQELKSALIPLFSDENEGIKTFVHNQKSVAVVFLHTPEDGLLGGLWLENDHAFSEAELQILDELSVTYAQSLALRILRTRSSFFKVGRYKKIILIGVFLAAFCPVRQTITAPAEVVAQNANYVTVPYEGMVEKILVDPGSVVEKGQVLALMESSTLSAQATMAEQALAVTESSLSRLRREALSNPDKKNDLNLLESEIEEKKIEYAYAKQRQDESKIKAPKAGTAIFSDARKLEGKPARMGEVLMMVADPLESELLIRVPVDALIPVEKSAQVRFYLNVSPFSGREAFLTSIGYQASPDPDGLLTYKLRAGIKDMDGLRIGWQGTAKIKGEWTVLSYALLRRPLIAFRHLTGI